MRLQSKIVRSFLETKFLNIKVEVIFNHLQANTLLQKGNLLIGIEYFIFIHVTYCIYITFNGLVKNQQHTLVKINLVHFELRAE